MNTRLTGLLDQTVAELDAGRIETAFDALVRELALLRSELGAGDFSMQVVPMCRAHGLYRRLAADPLTRRARRVHGLRRHDPVLLDYAFFGHWDPGSEPVSQEGKELFHCTAIRSEQAASIRDRRNYLGVQLDEACARRPDCQILAVGSGHLRESGRSLAVIGEKFGGLIALDEDREALAEVQHSSPSRKIQTVRAFGPDMLSALDPFARFDFIYAATLFEQLDAIAARAMVSSLWRWLRPGGRLLLANQAHDYAARAYFEAFSHFVPVTRDAEALEALAADLTVEEVLALRVLSGPPAQVMYLEIERA